MIVVLLALATVSPLMGEVRAIDQDRTLVATLRIGSRDVLVDYAPIAVPQLPSRYVEHAGWRYEVSDEGRPVRRFRNRGGWTEIEALYKEAQAQLSAAPEWRVKVIVASRQTVLNVDPNGVGSLRRGTIMDEELLDVHRGLAQAKVAIEAYTRGLVRVRYDLEIDPEPIVLTDPKPNEYERSQSDLYRARVSTGEFQAEDKVFRGPYQGLWVVHTPVLPRQPGSWPALIRFEPGDNLLGFQANVSDFVAAFFADVHRRSLEIGLDTDLTVAEESQGAQVASELAWRALSVSPLLFRADDWKELCDPKFVPGPWRVPVTSARKWADVKRPFTDIAFSQDRGGREREIGSFEFIELLAARQAEDIHRFLKPATHFASTTGVRLPNPIEGLEIKSSGERPPPQDQRIIRGFVAGSTDDPSYREYVRSGPGAFELAFPEGSAQAKALRFRFEVSAADPWGVRIRKGLEERYVHLSGTIAPVGEIAGQAPWLAQATSAPNTWVTVEIPLEAPEFKAEGPWHASLVSEPNSDLFQRASIPLMRLRIAGLEWADAAGTPTVGKYAPAEETPDAQSESWYARSLAAARLADAADADQVAALLKLLDDPNDTVVLNAVMAAARLAPPTLERKLGDLGLSPNVITAEFALRALAKMNRPSAWLAIRKTLDGSPYDRSRAVAAELLAQTRSPIYAGPIMLLSSLGWRSRLAAATALGHLDGDIAPTVHMALLIDPDPAVRIRTIQSADLRSPLVKQRLQFFAVNDPVDLVRAACCVRLIRSEDAGLVQEGFKGLRDDSRMTRMSVLRALAEVPAAGFQNWLLLAAGDAVPEIREAALQALLSDVYKLQPSDAVRLLAERNGRVQAAVVRLIQAKGIRPSREQWASFLSSPNPEVVSQVRALLGDSN